MDVCKPLPRDRLLALLRRAVEAVKVNEQLLELGQRAGAYTRPLSAQPQPFLSHLPVSTRLMDWGGLMHPTHPTKCA